MKYFVLRQWQSMREKVERQLRYSCEDSWRSEQESWRCINKYHGRTDRVTSWAPSRSYKTFGEVKKCDPQAEVAWVLAWDPPLKWSVFTNYWLQADKNELPDEEEFLEEQHRFGNFEVIEKLYQYIPEAVEGKAHVDHIIDLCGTPKEGGTGLQNLRECIVWTEEKFNFEPKLKKVCIAKRTSE